MKIIKTKASMNYGTINIGEEILALLSNGICIALDSDGVAWNLKSIEIETSTEINIEKDEPNHKLISLRDILGQDVKKLEFK